MWALNEASARRVDAICKVVAVIGVLGGGFWTAYTYFQTKTHDARIASLEARKPFEAERLNVYLKAMDSVGVMLTSKDANELAQARRDFLKLSRGSLALMGDKEVNARSALLAQCVDAKAQCNPALEQLASDFNASCRLSIYGYWDAFLPEDEITWVRLERLRH